MESKKITQKKVSILLFATLLSISIPAYAMQGTGTSENPLQITTSEELIKLKDGLDLNYKLMNNIDFQNATWISPCDFNKAFTGIFDGNGYKISNFKMDKTGMWSGFFSYLKGGTVKNLTLERVTVIGGSISGILVGEMNTNSTIENCHVDGSLSATSTYDVSGGLVGFLNNGTINRCSAKVTLETKIAHVGGLIGKVSGTSTVSNSFANVVITSTKPFVGGLIGTLESGNIINCSTTGSVTTTGDNSIGGFIGSVTTGNICNCISNVNTIGKNAWYTGGFIGRLINESTVRNCIISGDVDGGFRVGGVFGLVGIGLYGPEKVTSNVISGIILHDAKLNIGPGGVDNFAYIMGSVYPTRPADSTSLFYDSENCSLLKVQTETGNNTCGLIGYKNGTGKTSAELKTKLFYENLGFAFGSNENAPWVIETGYPVLWYQKSIPSNLNETKRSNINIYPNPFTNRIQILDSTPIEKVIIYTLSGNLIGVYNESTIDTENFKNGIYLLKVFTKDSIIVQKMIKE